MTILPRWPLFFFFLGLFLLLFHTAACQAGQYQWKDQAGTIHYSDSIPLEDVLQKHLNPADPRQRPLIKKPVILFADQVFRVRLLTEEDDSLQFDLTLNEIHRTFPDIIRGHARIFLCAVSQEVTSYLEYTVAPVEGGSTTLRLTNRLSKHSPEQLQTETLKILLYESEPGKTDVKTLFSREIPFVKIWEKKAAGMIYQ